MVVPSHWSGLVGLGLVGSGLMSWVGLDERILGVAGSACGTGSAISQSPGQLYPVGAGDQTNGSDHPHLHPRTGPTAALAGLVLCPSSSPYDGSAGFDPSLFQAGKACLDWVESVLRSLLEAGLGSLRGKPRCLGGLVNPLLAVSFIQGNHPRDLEIIMTPLLWEGAIPWGRSCLVG